jgi:hypothetical protein
MLEFQGRSTQILEWKDFGKLEPILKVETLIQTMRREDLGSKISVKFVTSDGR